MYRLTAKEDDLNWYLNPECAWSYDVSICNSLQSGEFVFPFRRKSLRLFTTDLDLVL